MAVTGTVQAKVSLAEVITVGVAGVSAESQKTITHTALGAVHNITAGEMAAGTKAMSAGAGTLNLQALPGTNGYSKDLSGLKVQWAWFRNTITNGNNITITFGVATPYNLGGAAFVYVLAPGQELVMFGNDATPEVAAGARNIDISGTLAQTLDYLIVAS